MKSILFVSKSERLKQPIEMQLSPNGKIFSQFISPFPKSSSNFEYLKEKMSLRGDLFLKLQTGKSGLLKCLKRPVSEHLWAVNMLRGSKRCLNEHGRFFVVFFDQSETKSPQKNFVLVASEILKLFVDILTSDEKYSLSVKASV